MAPLASAFIRLRPDTSGFRGETDADMGDAGRSAGRSFGDGFSRDASGRLHDARGRFARDFENGPPLRFPPVQPPNMPRIPNTTAKVDVDVSGARDKIQGLLLDISKLAAIPVGATLAVGVGAMVGAFGAAALGAGALKAVAVPAITAIKDALAAKTAAEKNSGQAEAQSAQQSFAIAGARQALATALRNAAYSHAQALEGVRAAEKNLSDAEKSAVDAEHAIGDARKAAIAQLADMQRGLANSALGLRGDQLSILRAKDALDRLNDTTQDAIALEQAQLGVRQARARLDEVNANKNSTQLDKDAAQLAVKQAEEQLRQQQQVAKQRELERKEAQLAFDQAQQRYKDDLAARKKEEEAARAAAKAGVDGSDQVRAAREALKAANDKVAESERALAKARADVGRADQASSDAVASARRGLTLANLQAAQSNGTLTDAMAKLTPAQRALAKDWLGLSEAFKKWQQSMEPRVLPLFSQGISILRGLLPSLTPVVEGASNAVGGLLGRLAAGARSPAFAQFRDALVALVPQSLTSLGNVAGDVAVGFGKIIQAFLPYAPAVLSFIERIAARFRDMAGGAVVSPGFTAFIDYVKVSGPAIAKTVSDIAQALAHVAASIAPLGGPAGLGVVSTFGLLARAISGMSSGQIQALAIAYSAVRVALVGFKIASVAADAIGAVNAALATGNGPLWARALAGAWTGMRNLASAAKDGVVWLWNHARAAAASALATLRLRAAMVGGWISSAVSALPGLVAGYWASARAGAASALAAARNAISTGLSTAASWASAAASWAAAAASGAWAAAMDLLDAAMDANPIGVVVLAVVALVAAFVLAYRNVGWFRDLVNAAWAGIQAAFAAAWAFIQPIFAAIGNWITGTLGPAFTWLWRNVIQPSFVGIGLLISFAWTNVIQPVFTAVWGFIQNVLGPVFGWLWRNVISPSFVGIGLLITTSWNTVIRPVFQAVWTFLSTVLGPVFTWLWHNVISPSFVGIGLLIGVAWNTVIKPIFTAIWTYLTTVLGPIFTWLWHTIIQPSFAGIGQLIGAIWTGGIQPVFNALKNAVGAVADSFGVGAGAIKTSWAKIQDYAKTPVNFIIGTVYNQGIRGLWNQVIDWLHLPKAMQLGAIPMLASGGTLQNPAPARPMVTNGPMAIVGEGRRQYPEFVIPTDPQYRGRATALWSAAGSKIGQFAEGGVLGGGDGWWDKVKGIAGGVGDLVGDALDLLTNPKKVWDKLVGAIPKPNFEGPFGTAINAIPEKITDSAWTVAEQIIKQFNDGYGGSNSDVVNAAAKYIGVGDDRGVNNNNIFTRRYGWPSGTKWCALFASAAIQDAHADKRYPGTPSAAVATFNAAMKHVPVNQGKAGDLATYGSNDHINIIVKKVGDAYDTIGGNQGPKVERGIRGGQATVLRPMAAGGLLSQVQAQRNFDRADDRDPAVKELGRMGPLFDAGGLLQPGPNNKTSRPEPVLTAQQWSALITLAERGVQPRGQLFGDVHVQEPTDVDMLLARADFLTRSKSF